MGKPRRAYSVQQVASALGASIDEIRALVVDAVGAPRDLLNQEDLARVEALLGRPKAPRSPRLEQTQFDFASPPRLDRPRRAPAAADPEAWFHRAVELEAVDPGEALMAYGEALAADPRYADAHVNRGRLLHQRGELKEAEAHYVAAMVAQPTDATAVFNLAVALEDSGRVDEAIARYQEAIGLDRSCVDAYFNLARLFEQKGDRVAALRHLKDYKRLAERRS